MAPNLNIMCHFGMQKREVKLIALLALTISYINYGSFLSFDHF